MSEYSTNLILLLNDHYLFWQAAQIWCGDWSWIQDTAQLVQRIVLHRVLVGRRRDSAGRHITHTQPALFLWLRRMLSADNLAHVSFIFIYFRASV